MKKSSFIKLVLVSGILASGSVKASNLAGNSNFPDPSGISQISNKGDDPKKKKEKKDDENQSRGGFGTSSHYVPS